MTSRSNSNRSITFSGTGTNQTPGTSELKGALKKTSSFVSEGALKKSASYLSAGTLSAHSLKSESGTGTVESQGGTKKSLGSLGGDGISPYSRHQSRSGAGGTPSGSGSGVTYYHPALDFELLKVARPMKPESLNERLAQPSSAEEVVERLRTNLNGADERNETIKAALKNLSTDQLNEMLSDLEWCLKVNKTITYQRFRESKGPSMAERLQNMREKLASYEEKRAAEGGVSADTRYTTIGLNVAAEASKESSLSFDGRF